MRNLDVVGAPAPRRPLIEGQRVRYRRRRIAQGETDVTGVVIGLDGPPDVPTGWQMVQVEFPNHTTPWTIDRDFEPVNE